MWKLYSRKQNNILLHVVDIGDRKIKVPVAQLGDGNGKTVLITAGMDGDEYSGIEAVYSLVEYFSKRKFSGRLIIIPVVNIPGFEQGVSCNPLDKKYPKHIFPGKEKGSATEKLMYWLSENFVQNVDIWIDVHSGASTECLDPFIWTWETQKKSVNEKIIGYLEKLKAKRIVFQKEKRTFVDLLARRNTAYILLESGELGKRIKRDIKQHIDWIVQLTSDKKSAALKSVFQHVSENVALTNGIWVPTFSGKTVRKGLLLGEVRSLDGKVLQKIVAKDSGTYLWRREAMYTQKGDDLYAYAYNKARLMK